MSATKPLETMNQEEIQAFVDGVVAQKIKFPEGSADATAASMLLEAIGRERMSREMAAQHQQHAAAALTEADRTVGEQQGMINLLVRFEAARRASKITPPTPTSDNETEGPRSAKDKVAAKLSAKGKKAASAPEASAATLSTNGASGGQEPIAQA